MRLQQSGFENQDLIVQLRESETRWQYAQSQVKLMQAETQRLEQEVRSLKQSQAGSTQLSALNKESALEHRLQQVYLENSRLKAEAETGSSTEDIVKARLELQMQSEVQQNKHLQARCHVL